MTAEMIMKQKVLAVPLANRQRNVFRLCVISFLAASLITAFQIVHAASPAPAPAKAPAPAPAPAPAASASASASSSAENSSKSKEQAGSGKEQQAYTAKRNMTVDELIKEVYAGTPLNNQVLVKALFEANPKVMNGKPTQSIKRNQVIYLPDHTHLVVQTLTPFTPLPTAVSTDTAQNGSQSSDQQSRRLWVRFP
jgi:nucleoid-associated protein YgaU